MKRSRAELKAEMMAQAELMVDELLDWNDQTCQPTLTQIEDVILKLRKQLSEQMTGTVIAAQEAVRPTPGPKCAKCGCEMHDKGMKQNTVESRAGVLNLERGYYYCETCQAGLFPPGSAT
jgi:hypothetical protein